MPATDDVLTIQCPSCKRSLPPRAGTCQFCGASLASVPRPVAAQKVRATGPKERWIVVLYNVVACWWILNGLRTIGATLFFLPPELAGAPMVTAYQVLGLSIGGFVALIGVGLLTRVRLARGIANFFCWVQILFGLLGILGTLGAIMFVGLLGVLYLLLNIIDVVVAGAQVWLIAETDDYFVGS